MISPLHFETLYETVIKYCIVLRTIAESHHHFGKLENGENADSFMAVFNIKILAVLSKQFTAGEKKKKGEKKVRQPLQGLDSLLMKIHEDVELKSMLAADLRSNRYLPQSDMETIWNDIFHKSVQDAMTKVLNNPERVIDNLQKIADNTQSLISEALAGEESMICMLRHVRNKINMLIAVYSTYGKQEQKYRRQFGQVIRTFLGPRMDWSHSFGSMSASYGSNSGQSMTNNSMNGDRIMIAVPMPRSHFDSCCQEWSNNSVSEVDCSYQSMSTPGLGEE